MLAAARSYDQHLHASDPRMRGSEELSPGDLAAAVNGYRAIFDYLVSNRSVADADITLSGEPEA
jgi:hypothetical protein